MPDAWDVEKPSDDLVDVCAAPAAATLPAAPARPDFVLQPRDLEIFAFVARHGVCTPGQLRRRFWPGAHVNGTYRRVEKLVQHGYLTTDRTWYHGPLAIRVTRQGLRSAGLPFHPFRLTWGRLPHQLAMVDLSEELVARHQDATWRTERELRLDWYADRARGIEHHRLPDGMIVLGGERIAVELELSEKRSRDYQALGDAYLEELILGMHGVWWFVAGDRIAEQLRRHFAPMYGDNPFRIEVWAASSS